MRRHGFVRRGQSTFQRDNLRGGLVELLAAERFGEMVALRGQEIVSVPIHEAIGSVRKVPQDHQLVQQAREIGVCFGDQLPPNGNRGR